MNSEFFYVHDCWKTFLPVPNEWTDLPDPVGANFGNFLSFFSLQESYTYVKIEFHTLVLIPHLVPIPAVEPAPLMVPIPLWNRLPYRLFWQSRTVAPAPVPTPEKIGIVSALI